MRPRLYNKIRVSHINLVSQCRALFHGNDGARGTESELRLNAKEGPSLTRFKDLEPDCTLIAPGGACGRIDEVPEDKAARKEWLLKWRSPRLVVQPQSSPRWKTTGLRPLRIPRSSNGLPRGLNVVALAPRFFRSDQTIWAFEDNKELREKLLARIPMGRPGKLEELEGTIACLASSAADYRNAQALILDGGFLSR